MKKVMTSSKKLGTGLKHRIGPIRRACIMENRRQYDWNWQLTLASMAIQRVLNLSCVDLLGWTSCQRPPSLGLDLFKTWSAEAAT